MDVTYQIQFCIKKVITTKAAVNDKLQQMRQHMTHISSTSRRQCMYTTMNIEGQNEIEKITLAKT